MNRTLNLIVIGLLLGAAVPVDAQSTLYGVSSLEHPHTLIIHDDLYTGDQTFAGDIIELTWFIETSRDLQMRIALFDGAPQNVAPTSGGGTPTGHFVPDASGPSVETPSSLYAWWASTSALSVKGTRGVDALDQTFAFTHVTDNTDKGSTLPAWQTALFDLKAGEDYQFQTSFQVPQNWFSIPDLNRFLWDINGDQAFQEQVGWVSVVSKAPGEGQSGQGNQATIETTTLDLLTQFRLNPPPVITCCDEPEPPYRPPQTPEEPLPTTPPPPGEQLTVETACQAPSEHSLDSSFWVWQDKPRVDFPINRELVYTLDSTVIVQVRVEGDLAQLPLQVEIDDELAKGPDGRDVIVAWIPPGGNQKEITLPDGQHTISFNALGMDDGTLDGVVHLERQGVFNICTPLTLKYGVVPAWWPLLLLAAVPVIAALGYYQTRHRLIYVPETNTRYCAKGWKGKVVGFLFHAPNASPFMIRYKDFPLPQDTAGERIAKANGVPEKYASPAAAGLLRPDGDGIPMPMDPGHMGQAIPGDTKNEARNVWRCGECPARASCWNPRKREGENA